MNRKTVTSICLVFITLHRFCLAAVSLSWTTPIPTAPDAFTSLFIQDDGQLLQSTPLTPFQMEDLTYSGTHNGFSFNAETIASASLSQANLLSIHPVYGYGYATTTLSIDASSYFSSSGWTKGVTEFDMTFWLASDEPFHLSIQASTSAVGSAAAGASILFPVISGGIQTGGYNQLSSYIYSGSATQPGSPQASIPSSFSEADVIYPAGAYEFRLNTDAQDYANDTSGGAAGGFSSLSFSMTATVPETVPEPSTFAFLMVSIGYFVFVRSRRKRLTMRCS